MAELQVAGSRFRCQGSTVTARRSTPRPWNLEP